MLVMYNIKYVQRTILLATLWMSLWTGNNRIHCWSWLGKTNILILYYYLNSAFFKFLFSYENKDDEHSKPTDVMIAGKADSWTHYKKSDVNSFTW